MILEDWAELVRWASDESNAVTWPQKAKHKFVHRVKDFKAALHWILWLLERHPQDIHLLSTAGCVQLDIGHTQAALTTFQVASPGLSLPQASFCGPG